MVYASKHINITARRWWIAVTICVGSLPPACFGFGLRRRDEQTARNAAARMMN